MTDLILNLRIGKLHIQINSQWQIELKINEHQKWFEWPFVQLH